MLEHAKSGGPLLDDVHRKLKTGISGMLDRNHSATSLVRSHGILSVRISFPGVSCRFFLLLTLGSAFFRFGNPSLDFVQLLHAQHGLDGLVTFIHLFFQLVFDHFDFFRILRLNFINPLSLLRTYYSRVIEGQPSRSSSSFGFRFRLLLQKSRLADRPTTSNRLWRWKKQAHHGKQGGSSKNERRLFGHRDFSMNRFILS